MSNQERKKIEIRSIKIQILDKEFELTFDELVELKRELDRIIAHPTYNVWNNVDHTSSKYDQPESKLLTETKDTMIISGDPNSPLSLYDKNPYYDFLKGHIRFGPIEKNKFDESE